MIPDDAVAAPRLAAAAAVGDDDETAFLSRASDDGDGNGATVLPPLEWCAELSPIDSDIDDALPPP